MGTYLSTPVTEKNEESGDSLQCPMIPVSWGVVDMQGWRKNMEDAHVAQTDVDVPVHHLEAQNEGNTVRHVDAKVFGVFDGHGGPEVARFCQLYFVSVLSQQPTWAEREEDIADESEEKMLTSCLPSQTPVGKALISTFHCLDRMIDDPARRDELLRLRSVKPLPGERHDADYIPPIRSSTSQEQESSVVPGANSTISAPNTTKTSESVSANNPETSTSSFVENNVESKPDSKIESGSDTSRAESASNTEGEDNKADDDSDKAVGLEEAVLDQNLMNENEGSGSLLEAAENSADALAGKVSVIFQRFLNMNGSSGQLTVQVNEGEARPANASSQGIFSPAPGVNTSTSASTPSLVRNGRLICNLPDHSVHAGATAVVAVIVGNTITVANAGDSRAVLCRNGVAFALSSDHKPLQERELSRIRKAGGFVNHFGRVNGNLNLSRSIGDLKYKQVPGIAPADQMITAEPDIVQLKLTPHDSFLILGCDGIWDCLTNEKAVEYVRLRIDSQTPTEIGVEMLNDIISEDPRSTQGIGGDNMTIMIVDLQPLSRSYRKASDASPI